MAEKLLEEIQTGQFLPLTLTIEPLQRILAQILALMKDHDAKMGEIGEALAGKADRSDLAGLSDNSAKFNEYDDKFKQYDDKFKEYDDKFKQYDDKLDGLLARLEDVEKKAEERDAPFDFEEFQKRQTDFEDAQNKRLDELIAALNELKAKEENDAAMRDEIEELKKRVDDLDSLRERLENVEKDVNVLKSESIPKVEQEMESAKQKIDDLETRMKAMELRERSTPRPPSSGEVSPNPRVGEIRIRSRGWDSQQEIEELVNALKGDVESMKREIEDLKKAMLERPDRAVVEKLFAQFKKSFAGIVEMIETAQAQNANFATLDDLRRLEAKIKQVNMEIDEAAAARKGMTCLSCGQPYRTVTNSIQDQHTMSILGAAPISQVMDGKQTIVYGSDHELYYSCPSPAHTHPFVANSPKAIESDT